METNVDGNLQSVAMIFGAIESGRVGAPVDVQAFLAGHVARIAVRSLLAPSLATGPGWKRSGGKTVQYKLFKSNCFCSSRNCRVMDRLSSPWIFWL